MKIFIALITVILMSMTLTACTRAVPSVPTTINSKETAYPTITSSPSPTVTAQVSTSTPGFTATPQAFTTEKSEIVKSCPTVLTELPKDKTYSGQIVLHSPYTFWNIETGKKYEIPRDDEHWIWELAVSPDRAMYAYVYYRSGQVVIASSDHEIIHIAAIPDRWRFSRWQSDESLLFVIPEPDPGGSPHWGKYPPTLGLLKPFTGEQQELTPDFPNIDELNPILDFGGSGVTVYDPALTRVVYERMDWNVVLWDIQKKKQLAGLPFLSLPATNPIWLPDGSKYIMIAEDGYFYLVTRDGEITRVSSVKMNAENFSWSPDNQHLAFWRVSQNLEDRTLIVLDTITGQMSDLCIPIGYDPLGGYGPIAPIPIWSPSGNSIVVEANFNPNTSESDVLLIDLEDNTVTKIGENSLPVGWLTE